MKPPVVGPLGRPEAASARRPAKAAGTAGRFADHLDALPAIQAADPAPPAAEAFALDALVALQALADDAGEGRRGQARRHGESLLDSLDRLRTDLLLGRIPGDRLVQLVRSLRERDGPSGDAALDQTLDAIELRAEVELAKLSHRR